MGTTKTVLHAWSTTAEPPLKRIAVPPAPLILYRRRRAEGAHDVAVEHIIHQVRRLDEYLQQKQQQQQWQQQC